MFIEKIKSDGLAHLSYLVGDGGEAAVIDPRRDCDIYVEHARRRDARITHIFETHRNEDLISGAPVLAAMTGASVHHGPNADGEVRYADVVTEGTAFEFGNLRLTVLETPGHTFDSLSFALYDTEFGDEAVAVFTGDALFIGDVGRTDFYPDRAEEVAGLLYDSLQKLLALGDQTLLYPAHGAGSVCGSGMADREFSSIGYERRNNPRARIADRDAFIRAKVNETHYRPPYFATMERLNLEGAEPIGRVADPRPLTGAELTAGSDARLVDIRGVTDFAGAHVPGALCIPVDMLPAFAGWFLDEGDEIRLIADDRDQARAAAGYLARIGFDRIAGAFTGVVGHAATGRSFATLPFVDHGTVARRLEDGANDWTLLDVRAIDEVEDKRIEAATHIYTGHLPSRIGDLDRARHYTVMCASGARATIAASYLVAEGFANVDVFFGSMGAWQAHHGKDEAK